MIRPAIAQQEFICANCFDYDFFATHLFDRIYVGANCPPDRLPIFKNALKQGGILIVQPNAH